MLPLEQQLGIIRRGVEQLVPEAELRQKLERSLKTGKPLRVKYGIDPTGFEVHLGHTVSLRKMRQFQELGHQAVLIIGNYTALIGDPSGRDQSRVRLTVEQVEANAKDYLQQVAKVIDIRKSEVTHNGDWFAKWSFLDVVNLTGKTTVQRLLERDDFTKRFKASPSVPIYLHECLYPLMQGQDSVEVRADVELGGSEQLFNLMMGRQLQTDAGQEPQICITMPLLRGLDGAKKMGKSLGNYVGVGEPANTMFGKIMSIPDALMREWFELLTDRSAAELTKLADPNRTHPRQAKETLAKDIVGFYHGPAAAAAAAAEFVKVFAEKKDPDEIPDVAIAASDPDVKAGKLWIAKLLVKAGLSPSTSEGQRLVNGGGVTMGPDRSKVTDPKAEIPLTDGLLIRVGSRKIARIRVV